MATQDNLGPGKEVLSYCGKCKLSLAHVIVALNKKGSIEKCECKTCGAVHRYRDPEKPVKTAGTKEAKKAHTRETLWKEALSIADGAPKPYSMTAEFVQGEIVNHPKFGNGVVLELIGFNKIKTIFESGEKILIHTRS